MMWGHLAREEMVKNGEGGGERWEYETWVRELMVEEEVRALPRDKERLGRLMDGRAFWRVVESSPETGRVA